VPHFQADDFGCTQLVITRHGAALMVWSGFVLLAEGPEAAQAPLMEFHNPDIEMEFRQELEPILAVRTRIELRSIGIGLHLFCTSRPRGED
jgi:hypothetical protein